MKTLPVLCLVIAITLVALPAQTPKPAETVALAPEAPNANMWDTKEYKIRPGLISREFLDGLDNSWADGDGWEVKNFFVARGVEFPPGSRATYIVRKNLLIVTNKTPSLKKIEALTERGNAGEPGDPFVKEAGANEVFDLQTEWRNVVVVLEVYALPKEDALAILEGEGGSIARYQRVLDLAKTKKARLEILTALTTKSGQKATTESIDEVRYATEFQPGAAKGMPSAESVFETRNVGDTLAVEPVISPSGEICELGLEPHRTSLAGFHELAAAPGDRAVAQPRFIMQKLSLNTSLTVGEPRYLGTLSPPGENGIATGAGAEIWLAFLRVHYHGPQPGEVKPPAKAARFTQPKLEYSVYSLDRAQAREILATMPTLEAPWEKLQSLLREKQARFEHLVTIETRSGQKAIVEENDERRSVTEYAPAGHTRATETTKHTPATRPAPADRNNDGTEVTTLLRDTPNSEGTPGAPASVETRNAGVTIEVEPVIGPDSITVNLSHVIRSLSYRGKLKTVPASPLLEQPLFEERRVTTSQSVTAGRHLLVGTFNPPGADGVNERTDDGRTWLLFVRVMVNEP